MTASPPTVTREAGTSRPARRAVGRRPSGSHLLIGAVVVLAFALNYLALQNREATKMVALADRQLPAGSSLSVSDLRFSPVDADFEGIESLIAEDLAQRYDGWILQQEIVPGEVVQKSMLVEPGAPTGFRSMSLPVPIEHAAGGTLSAGDRIDVISVDSGKAEYVAENLEVLGVFENQGGSLGGIVDYHLIVAVDQAQALALAVAIDSGSMEVVRSTGATDDT